MTAQEEADKIVIEFQNMFGAITRTERYWLSREIANAIQLERNRVPREQIEAHSR